MPKQTADLELTAVNAVYKALAPLDRDTQGRVIDAVLALLGSERRSAFVSDDIRTTSQTAAPTPTTTRRTGLAELVSEKKPATNTQKIALFAYYRDKVEQKARFSRGDLRDYFQKAKVPPPSNFDRDFGNAVERGWVHEDKDQSYVTTKGIEAVEQGFEGKQTYTDRRSSGRGRKAVKRGGRRG